MKLADNNFLNIELALKRNFREALTYLEYTTDYERILQLSRKA